MAVEERIDHERVKEIAEDVLTSQKELDESKWGGYVWEHLGDAWSDFSSVARAYLALLTEHSARDYALVQVEYLLDPATGSPRPTEALRVARRALPATEPAQPEEEQ